MRMPRLPYCLLLPLLLLAGGFVQGQEGKTLRAMVMDSLEKTPVEKCTVSLLSKKDTIQKVTDSKGVFSFPLPSDSAVLLFQHLGFSEKRLVLSAAEVKKGIDTVYLQPLNRMLEDIVVSTRVPPVVVRGDTTEFNIDSSMFERMDVVEDLVRRLPGLEIDPEGRMSFNGKPITRILVDGEDLFGGDPTFSIKKLPAGLVAKIQVMDTKTLEQIFNGDLVDGEDKTLNIKLKPGNKTFGSGDALAGTSNQLEGNGMLSFFDGNRRLSAMGSASSSNKTGLLKIRPGPQSSFTNASANYDNKWGKLRMSSNYAYNQNGSTNEMYRERTQVITADTSLFTRARARSDHTTSGHRAGLGAYVFLDSSSQLDMSMTYNRGQSNSRAESASATLENGALRNESVNNSHTSGQSETIGTALLWTKRFRKKGRTLTLNARTNSNSQVNETENTSINTYFKNSLPVNGDTLNRLTRNTTTSSNYAVNINYAEPISQRLSLRLRTDLDFNRSGTDREVYNLDSTTGKAVYDSLYSATIASTSNTQSYTASLAYRYEKWNVTTGMTTVVQQAVRSLQGEELRQDLLRFAPSVTASYALSRQRVLRLNFSANTIQPTIEQLQPVPDNSNPLYIRIGNPALRTAFAQNYGLSYTYNNDTNNLAVNFNYAPVSNQIVNAVYYDEYWRQTSQYINVSGVYSMRGSLAYTHNNRKGKQTKSWTANTGLSYGRQVYFQASQLFYTHNYSTLAGLSFSRREMAVRAASYRVSLNSSYSRNWTPADTKILNTTRLTLSPELEGACNLFDFIHASAAYRVGYNKFDYHSLLRRNDEYSTHQLSNDLRFQVRKKWSVTSTLNYQYNTRVPEGTPKGLVNMNISASAHILKGSGLLTFTAVDLFAMNNSLRRTVGENFIEDVQVESLRNYFTLKFQYSFSQIASSK